MPSDSDPQPLDAFAPLVIEAMRAFALDHRYAVEMALAAHRVRGGIEHAERMNAQRRKA